MKKIILLLLLSITTSTMFAGTFSCASKVNKVLLYKNGAVNVHYSARNNYTYICNLNSEWKGVSTTTCAMWVGLLQDIKKRNTDARAVFYYSTNDATSCANLPTYGSAPSPVYIGEY